MKLIKFASSLVLLFGFLSSCSRDSGNGDEATLGEGVINCARAKPVLTEFLKAEYERMAENLRKQNPIDTIYRFCPRCNINNYLNSDEGNTIQPAYLGKVPHFSNTMTGLLYLVDYQADILGSKLESITIPPFEDIDLQFSDDCRGFSMSIHIKGKMRFQSKVPFTILTVIPLFGHLSARTDWDFDFVYNIKSDNFESIDSSGNPGIGYSFTEVKPAISSFSQSEKLCIDFKVFDIIPDFLNIFCPKVLEELDTIKDFALEAFQKGIGTAIDLSRRDFSCFFDGGDLKCGTVFAEPYFAIASTFDGSKLCARFAGTRYLKALQCRAQQAPVEDLLFIEKENRYIASAARPNACLGTKEGADDERRLRVTVDCDELGIPFVRTSDGQMVSQAPNSNPHTKFTGGLCLDVDGWASDPWNWGKLRNGEGRFFQVHNCHRVKSGETNNQTFTYKDIFIIRSQVNSDFCFQGGEGENVRLKRCNGKVGDQLWKLYTDGSIRRSNNKNLCISHERNGGLPKLLVENCGKAGNRALGFTHKRNYNIAKTYNGATHCIDSQGAKENSELRLHPNCGGEHDDQLYWFHLE